AMRHDVMTAILMNSAQKVKGRLGMTKTILKSDGTPAWDNSDARDVPSGNAQTDLQRQRLPLDADIGVGALDTSRAQTQLRGGRFAPQAANTGPVGWDYRAINGQGTFVKYTLPRLRGGSWMSATL